MTPDPEPWYSTTLNVWTMAGVLVACWSLAKTVTSGWRRTIGLRRYLTARLRKIAPGVRHDYVESLLGEPKWQSTMTCHRLSAAEDEEAVDDDRKVEITVRTWPLARLGYLVAWSAEDAVVMFGLTTTSWWFRPRVMIGDTRIRLGKTPFAVLGSVEEHRAWIGNRRFGYWECHYFGNLGGYRSWYVGVNDIGYKAVAPFPNWFDNENDFLPRLPPDHLAAYRARAVVNTVVVSGMASYKELEDGSFFGISLGVDQDVVRLAHPEYHVLDSRTGRARRWVRDWRWLSRFKDRRWEKKYRALQDR
ncbi:ETEC_3214 domain-containing protein [Streptomyces geranii]|uniref:ETEC_3214 domain-containing protein n=1 Tax=Streptomyces geranii TaxID=2058923 RepID=UPI000D046F0A|nr:ETEC_3214 domain-containing protein [Streptomyces geranii]